MSVPGKQQPATSIITLFSAELTFKTSINLVGNLGNLKKSTVELMVKAK